MSDLYYRQAWCALAKILAKAVTLSRFSNVVVEGEENIPKDGPALICPSHRSDYDSFVLIASSKRRLNYMAASEHFKNPIYSNVIYRAGGFPVKKGVPDRSAFEYGKKLLLHSEALVVYPEGSLNKTKKAVMRIRGGAAMIGLDAALESGKPIPVITAAHLYFPFDAFGSNAYLGFSKPFFINDYLAQYKTNNRGAVAIVSRVIEEGIVKKVREIEEEYGMEYQEESDLRWMF